VQNPNCAFDSLDRLRDDDEATHGGAWTRHVSAAMQRQGEVERPG
jgi:hypothetical protein